VYVWNGKEWVKRSKSLPHLPKPSRWWPDKSDPKHEGFYDASVGEHFKTQEQRDKHYEENGLTDMFDRGDNNA